MHSFGIARRAQAWACPNMGPRLTIVFLTFTVLAHGGGGVLSLIRKGCMKNAMENCAQLSLGADAQDDSRPGKLTVQQGP